MEKYELFDIVNENDEVIGQATREECHSNPNITHRTVGFTLIKSDGKLLITKRGLGKRFDPGKYIFLGEHMIAGENYEQGVIRGAKEEIGIDIKEYKDIGTYKFNLPEQTELVHFFLIKFDDKQNLKYDSSEILEEYWMTPEEILKSSLDLGGMTKTWLEILSKTDFESLKWQ